MRSRQKLALARRRTGGAVAWKLLLAIAAGVAAIWAAAQSSIAPPQVDTRSAGGAIAYRVPVPDPEAPGALSESTPPADARSDPFAGVDLSANAVLSHIARIEDKVRGKAGASREAPAVRAPAHAAAAAAAANAPSRGDGTPEGAGATAPLRVSARTMPAFPPEAMRAGIHQGRVLARLSIEPDGRVSGTQILSAAPVGFFERESRRALATWRYEPPGQPATIDVELVFNRE
jgi:protein TonB